MKMVFVGDSHFGDYSYGSIDPETGENSRMQDLFRNFDEAVGFAINKKVDLFLHCGDVYKLKVPKSVERKNFNQRVKRLIDNEIYFVVVVGNHDITSRWHNLDFKEFDIKHIKVIDTPEIVELELGSIRCSILGVPWLTKAWLEQQKVNSISEVIKSLSKEMNGDVNILAAHLHVREAKMGPTDFVLSGEEDISLRELIDLGLDACCLGHIHKTQVLSSDPFVAYVGSIGKIDFGERDEKKGFYCLEFS